MNSTVNNVVNSAVNSVVNSTPHPNVTIPLLLDFGVVTQDDDQEPRLEQTGVQKKKVRKGTPSTSAPSETTTKTAGKTTSTGSKTHKKSAKPICSVGDAMQILQMSFEGHADQEFKIIARRIDDYTRFSDGTLDDVRTALNDRLKGIRMEYLPQTFWSQRDKANARAMIQAIDKRLKTRRIMRSLERFVGGRPYGGDLRLLQRTI
ncbi:hypothetical protein Tco_1151424 [Tanacetum coccineum]